MIPTCHEITAANALCSYSVTAKAATKRGPSKVDHRR